MRELKGPRGPRLFEEPLLLRRARKDLFELVGLIWLAVEIARLVRSRLEQHSPARS
jgi:hypothetical protein